MKLLRSKQFFIYFALLCASWLLLACGGNNTYSPTGSAPIVTPVSGVAITGRSPVSTLQAGGSVQLTATVTGTSNTGVTWSVLTQNGGTVTSAGVYTPGAATSGQVTIQVQSIADPTKVATITITVTQPVITIAVTPATASVVAGGTVQFRSTVTGTTNTAVTWSVLSANGGTISSTGLYTAPAPTSSNGNKVRDTSTATYTVQAASVANPAKKATATVTVSQPVVTIAITPATTTTYPEGSVQFTAKVTGTTNTAVTWSVVTQNEGTITQTGLYTAPGNDEIRKKNGVRVKAAKPNWEINQNPVVTIMAVSQADPTKSATATVTIANLVVTISPAFPTLVEGQSLKFSAVVTGTTNQSVQWFGDDGGGTIDAKSGVLTAGYVPGTYQIICYSQANGTQGYTDFTVVPPSGISVSVNPSTITTFPGANPIQLVATVKGTSDQKVTYQITGSYVGTLSSTGLYTPPQGVDGSITFNVLVTSQADPTKTATATITVQST